VAQAFGCSSMQCGIPVRPKKLHRKEIKLTPKKVIKTEIHSNNFSDVFFGGIGIWVSFGNLSYGPPKTIPTTILIGWSSLDTSICFLKNFLPHFLITTLLCFPTPQDGYEKTN
jgi:hypothetical protein